jgi:hypothetical protein
MILWVKRLETHEKLEKWKDQFPKRGGWQAWLEKKVEKQRVRPLIGHDSPG